MTTDTTIREAILAAVAEAKQDHTLAHKLIRWFEAIASGNEDFADTDSTDRHLELLYRETVTGTTPHNAETEDEDAPHVHQDRMC